MLPVAGLILGAALGAAAPAAVAPPAKGATGPAEAPAGRAMRVPPLGPTWTTAGEATRHAEDDVPADSGPGDRTVRTAADRAGLACLEELRRLGIPFQREKPTKGIDTPVVITGPIRGLKLTPRWGRKPALMDCRFALTMHRVARVVLAAGVNELLYSSFYSYRNVSGSRWLSRHAFGLAVDVFEVRGPRGLVADVQKDWVKVVGTPKDCVGAVTERKARALRQLACDLEKSGLVHLVLTPDSDHAHRDHLHVSGFREGEKQGTRTRYAGRIQGRTWIPRRAVRAPGHPRPAPPDPRLAPGSRPTGMEPGHPEPGAAPPATRPPADGPITPPPPRARSQHPTS